MRGVRRLLSSLNLFATLALLGGLFIMVNYLSSRRYARWDLTRQKITALSDQTVQILKSLAEPLPVVVFYQPTHRLYEWVKDLLDEYARVNPNIRVEYVDPEQDIARAKQLAQQLQIEELNIVVFQSGSRHKYLTDTDLADYDYATTPVRAEPRIKAFKGEEAFTSAMLSVTQAESPVVWFISGHGEKSVESLEPVGLSELKKYLEQQNMSVQTVTLLERPSMPTNVRLLVIPGPTHRFTDTELALVQAYLDQGGRLLALVDPLDESGLDGLLERWGITLGMDIVVDPARQLPFVSAANLFVTTYSQHPIVEKMKTLMTLFPLARSVRVSSALPEGLTATSLAFTSESGWGETQTAVTPFQFNDGQDLKGPISIAVAAEHVGPPPHLTEPETTSARTRLVVMGDSDFIVNAQLGNVGNRDFLLGALYWLTEQEQRIGIGPKTLESIKLSLTGAQLTGLFWVSFLAMPFACSLIGVGVWFIRRT